MITNWNKKAAVTIKQSLIQIKAIEQKDAVTEQINRNKKIRFETQRLAVTVNVLPQTLFLSLTASN